MKLRVKKKEENVTFNIKLISDSNENTAPRKKSLFSVTTSTDKPRVTIGPIGTIAEDEGEDLFASKATIEDKKKLLQMTMIRWAENNSSQRVMTRDKRQILQNPKSENTWQDDFTLVLKNSRGKLTKDKKRILNKIWNSYK